MPADSAKLFERYKQRRQKEIQSKLLSIMFVRIPLFDPENLLKRMMPVLKHLSFGKAVNITLGLPFIRTSVDHGTALELAGTGAADAGSLRAALVPLGVSGAATWIVVGVMGATGTTMTIGAANVTAFIGDNGPYWTDLDGDHEVSWALADGTKQTQQQAGSADSVVDVDETAELNGNAVGFHITDLDVGIILMAATDPADLGVLGTLTLQTHPPP